MPPEHFKASLKPQPNSIFALCFVVGMNVPPSGHARDIRVVRRSKLFQVGFVKYTGCECDGRLVVDCADSGAAGVAKGFTRVRGRTPCRWFSARTCPFDTRGRELDPRERQRARMFAAASARASMGFARSASRPESDSAAQAAAFVLFGFHVHRSSGGD